MSYKDDGLELAGKLSELISQEITILNGLYEAYLAVLKRLEEDVQE